MTAVFRHPVLAADMLAPVAATLRAMFGGQDVAGLAPGLVVPDDTGWLSATALVDGSRLPDMLDAAERRWQASVHAAAALAWKGYSYWLALPAVVGWSCARRVPLLRPSDVLVRLTDDRSTDSRPAGSSPSGIRPAGGPAGLSLRLGLRPSVRVAVLPADPLARAGPSGARVVADEAALLAVLRESLLDAHLTPMAAAIQARTKLGIRALRGSVSSGVAYALLRAADVLAAPGTQDVGTVLTTLGLANLIELATDRAGRPTVRRKTCCLAFTLPRPKICPGCCIRA